MKDITFLVDYINPSGQWCSTMSRHEMDPDDAIDHISNQLKADGCRLMLLFQVYGVHTPEQLCILADVPQPNLGYALLYAHPDAYEDPEVVKFRQALGGE